MKTPVSVKNRHWCFVSYYMLNHPEVLQRLFNCLFLLRRALRLLDIFGLWLIVVLTLNDTAFLLYLCDIQAADLQAAMLQHIILNLLIGSFFLCISQIQLVQNQLPRCKHSSTVLGSYVAAHSTCLSLLLPPARKRGMRICLSLLLHIIE